MSLPRYDSYKDSGVEWLGDVPSHWSPEKLKYIATFSGGGTPSRENLDYWNGGIPWVSPKDMKAPLISETEETITDQGLLSSAASLVPPGAVLMVVRSGILRHTIPLSENVCEVALNQDMKAIRFSDISTARFFRYWVSGFNGKLIFVWSKQGATVESIEHSYLSGTVIPLPAPLERQAIVSFLDKETAKIDALIAAQERLIELLKEKRQAVISHAVTKGLDPSVPMKDSGVEWIGEIPAHWRVVPLRSLFSFVKRQDGEELEVLSVYRDYGVIPKSSRDDNNNVTPEDLSKYQKVRVGDLVVNKMKAWQGSLGISKYDGITSPDYAVFKPIHRGLSSFLHLLLRCELMPDVYRLISNGIRPSQWRLEPDKFKELKVPLPPLPEQQAISELVNDQARRYETLATSARQAISLLQERRAALISAAVTGKIDVRSLIDTSEAA